MRITVRAWGNLRRFLPDEMGTAALEVADGTTVEALAERLALQHELYAAAINGTVVPFSARLQPGDQLFLFDHLHGG